MYDNNIEMTILIKDRPITEFPHNGKIFVEGRGGSEYSIRVRNKTGKRVEAVLSVDGLSIMDGKKAGPESSGYLLNAFETITIPGWKLDSNAVAKFAFSGKQESYSTQMSGGDSRNNGVIGIMAYAEKYRAPVYTPAYPTGLRGGNVYPTNASPYLYGSSNSNIVHDGHIVSSNASYKSSRGISASASMSSARPSLTKGIARAASAKSASFGAKERFEIEQQSLGTAFGESASFATQSVEFERGDMISMMVLYYDDSRGLKARGIVLVRPSQVKYQTEPDAFPGMTEGCRPPPNWRG